MIRSKGKVLSSGQHRLHYKFHHSKANKSAMNSPMELVPDFMAVLVICKFDEDQIKIEVAILRTTFSPL